MIVRSIDAIITMLDCEYIENASLYTEVKGVCIDSRQVEPGNLYVPIVGANANGHNYAKQAIEKGAVCVLWNKNEANPPKDVVVLLVDDTLKALQKLAVAYRKSMNAKFVAVTGSNGKTSTKDIVASLLATKYKTQKTQGNLNSEFGVPLTLLSFDQDLEMGVVEMGMENLGEISLLSKMVEPDVALITNVGIAHLENLGSIENIARAKMEIVDGLKSDGTLILPKEDEILRKARIEKEIAGSVRIKTFGRDGYGCDYNYSEVKAYKRGLMVTINDQEFYVDMVGVVQGANATAAYAIADTLFLDAKQMKEGFEHIEKTGLRNELIDYGKCLILNDAYKSNPQSAIAALDTLEEFDYEYKIVVIADMLDLGDETEMIHFNLGKQMAEYKIDEVLTYGDLGRFIAQGANTYCDNVLVKHFEDKKEIAQYLKPMKDRSCMILFKGSRGMRLETIVNEMLGE